MAKLATTTLVIFEKKNYFCRKIVILVLVWKQKESQSPLHYFPT